MHADGINRRCLCKAAVAVVLVGISKSITPHAAAESKAKAKAKQMTRVPSLLDEKGRRNFHACRTLPELCEGDFTGLLEHISAERCDSGN